MRYCIYDHCTEVLKQLKDFVLEYTKNGLDRRFIIGSCDIIETELKKYKDIEEELGIDLITLFKLINAENVYSYGHTNIMKNTGQVDIYDKTITIWNGNCHQTYPLSEYGKAFALTKEELL